jgi:hypothetical protein
MGACNLIQRDNLCDVESLPPSLKRVVDVASRFDLCFRWHIVAADEEESCVHKYKLPDRSLRRWRVGRISRNGTTLRQNLGVRLDVRPKSDFHDVMNAIGSQSMNSFNYAFPGQQNFVRPSSRRDFLSLSARQVARTRAPA